MNSSIFDIPLHSNGTFDDTVPEWGSGGAGAKLGSRMVNTCGVFALVATLISLMSMFTHLKSYTKPVIAKASGVLISNLEPATLCDSDKVDVS